jgi:HPt (histidine-containing phosphotransfer) domain-containing protein
MLGGDIQVLSEPGKGSTFTLTINPGPLEGVRVLDLAAESRGADVPTAGAMRPSGLYGAGETPAPQAGDAAVDLTEAFAVELPVRSRFIQEALRDRNLELLARLTHQLAGTAAIYGFAQVSDAARAIHQRVTEEEALQQIETAVAELARLCAYPPRNASASDGPASLARSAGEG